MNTNKETSTDKVSEQTIAKHKPEEDFTESEAHTHQLFSSMTNMFDALDIIYFSMELTYDESGKPVDGIFCEVNPATERLFGRSKEQLIGKSRKELFGNVFDELPEKFGEVLKTEKLSHFEGYGAGLHKYYRLKRTLITSTK